MITKHPTKRDWFRIDVEDAQPLFGRPGLKIEGARFIAHRNMLPLLDHPEVAKLLAQPQSSKTWAARDARTKPLGFTLRATQQQAIDFIMPRRGVLVGDDMRLGKTLTAIMTHDPSRGQFIVVAPLSARGVWLGWIKRAFPDADIGVFTSRKFDPVRAAKPFVFAHYDILAAWQGIYKPATLVFDEAHMLGNHKTKRTAAAAILASGAERVIALTGTPIWDMPPDLWSLASILAPAAWGSYYEFCQRYGAPVSTAYGTTYTGLSNGDELKERMREVMIRRRWIDVAEDVPPITRSVVIADIDERERRKLDIYSEKLKSERTNTAGNLAAYRKQVSLYKVPTICAEAGKVIARGEPVVVWTWHKETAAAVAAKLPGSFMIHGDIPAEERERRITAWRATPASALVATMAVAQVALDFSHARITVFGEIEYVPAILGQAEMRTFSPTRGMDAIFIVANHLVEQRIVRALINKLSAADPLGVGAAVDAIDALRDAVLGPQDDGDLDRLFEDLLASAA